MPIQPAKNATAATWARRACVILLAVSMTATNTGCCTVALWDGYHGVGCGESAEDWWPLAWRVLATPVAATGDAALIAGYLYLATHGGHHHHHGHCHAWWW